MDKEIKRLLRLEQIKGFNLLASEKKKLEEWKRSQKAIKPIVPKKPKVPKDHTELEIGANDTPTIVPNEEIKEPVVENTLVKNVVEEKETGELEK